MSKSVNTTVIEKKYRDKRTNTEKVLKIDYAKVNDRLMEFRKDYPRGKISTRSFDDDKGLTKFKAYIWKDKTDYIEALKSLADSEIALLTADSDASARNNTGEEKDFEKLETIAVGRALAYLGYSVSGEIASSDEMEAFNKYQAEQRKKKNELAIEAAKKRLKKAKSLKEMKAIWISLGAITGEPEVQEAKDKLKEVLSGNTTD